MDPRTYLLLAVITTSGSTLLGCKAESTAKPQSSAAGAGPLCLSGGRAVCLAEVAHQKRCTDVAGGCG